MKPILVVLLILMFSGAAQAESIAVVALDDAPETRRTAAHIAQMLISNGKSASFGEPITNVLKSHRVIPNPADSDRFSGFITKVDKATEVFYYSGEQKALTALGPLFHLGLSYFAHVTSSTGLSSAHFEAGVLMVRAYVALNRAEDAMATAKLIARHYPARQPSLESTPPKIIELIQKAQEELFAQGARLGITPIGPEECHRLLNGSEVGEGLFPVPANTQLFLQIRCGDQTSSLMTLKVAAGKQVMAPVPLEMIENRMMTDDSFESRRSAEERLRVLKFWGGYSTLVGVRTPERPNGQAPTLFAHLTENTVKWTETDGVPAFVGFVEVAFALELATPESRTDWVAWSLVGGGVLFLGGGSALYFWGASDARAIVCSGNATEKPLEDCDDNGLGNLTEAEFESAVASADLKQVSGVVLAGVGLATITWGVVRFLTSEEPGIALLPTSNGVQVFGKFGGQQW